MLGKKLQLKKGEKDGQNKKNDTRNFSIMRIECK